MAEPKKRITSTRSGNRRSHLALKATKLAKCSQCHEPSIYHQVCPTCGYYKGEKIIDVDKKKNKNKEKNAK